MRQDYINGLVDVLTFIKGHENTEGAILCQECLDTLANNGKLSDVEYQHLYKTLSLN